MPPKRSSSVKPKPAPKPRGKRASSARSIASNQRDVKLTSRINVNIGSMPKGSQPKRARAKPRPKLEPSGERTTTSGIPVGRPTNPFYAGSYGYQAVTQLRPRVSESLESVALSGVQPPAGKTMAQFADELAKAQESRGISLQYNAPVASEPLKADKPVKILGVNENAQLNNNYVQDAVKRREYYEGRLVMEPLKSPPVAFESSSTSKTIMRDMATKTPRSSMLDAGVGSEYVSMQDTGVGNESVSMQDTGVGNEPVSMQDVGAETEPGIDVYGQQGIPTYPPAGVNIEHWREYIKFEKSRKRILGKRYESGTFESYIQHKDGSPAGKKKGEGLGGALFSRTSATGGGLGIMMLSGSGVSYPVQVHQGQNAGSNKRLMDMGRRGQAHQQYLIDIGRRDMESRVAYTGLYGNEGMVNTVRPVPSWANPSSKGTIRLGLTRGVNPETIDANIKPPGTYKDTARTPAELKQYIKVDLAGIGASKPENTGNQMYEQLYGKVISKMYQPAHQFNASLAKSFK